MKEKGKDQKFVNA